MRRAVSLSLVAALTAFATVSCSGDKADTAAGTSTPSAQSTTLSDCAALIPDSVVSTLGWTGAATATVDSATCSRATEQGTISVGRRPVAASGVDDLPAAGQKAYNERCGSLTDGQAGETVDWLGADIQGCAAVTTDGLGTNVLLALTPMGLLVEARVSVDQQGGSAEHVQQALTDLAETATQQLA